MQGQRHLLWKVEDLLPTMPPGAGKHPGANKNDNSCQSPREGIGATIGNVLSKHALGVGVGGQARDRGER